jgi:ankyrin repeat protein
MFPNPHDALPLPAHPNLEQYKKLAKDLVIAANSDDPAALKAWARTWIESLVRLANLSISPQLPVNVDQWTEQVESFARAQKESAEKFSVTRAQFVLARTHCFESWPKFASQIEALALANSMESHFENAADAIVTGDISTLQNLLGANPKLIRARSARQHRARLLHYVAANGVEGYRQKTPANIVEIAQLLLDSGAEVDATADVYGGAATTLALVATSVHPEHAGVQEKLLQLLLDHGASPHRKDEGGMSILNSCLANGRPRAAEFLASHGAPLDLESAAGLGKMELVQGFFDRQGSLVSTAPRAQLERGFLWACEYGRTEVVEYLLKHGLLPSTHAGTGQTALHWTVIGAHVDIISLLLARGADLEKKNSYGGTALGQALWSATHSSKENENAYIAVIKLLIKSGARVEESMRPWLAQHGLSASE